MNYYQEISLLPDVDIGLSFLWEKVYQRLHLGLVAIKTETHDSPVGVSFPNYHSKVHPLGHQLRLFAETEQQLAELNARQWLEDFADNVHLTGIRAVPVNKIKHYASFYRIHPPASNQQLARRRVKRQAVDLDAAVNYFAGRKEAFSHAPFIYLKSRTNGERFQLFIGYQEKSAATVQGFSCYGLSRDSTVPVF